MNLHERLDLCMKDGRTQAGIARACGIAAPSVSAWFSGKTKKIEGANLLKASAYLGVRPEWLATGLGPMHLSDAPIPRNPGDEFVPIQRVNLRASAGITGFAVDPIEGNGPPIFFRADWIATKRLNPATLYALKIVGDSMEPGLWEGDLIVLDSADASPKDGEVFVVNYEGEVLIKRLRRDAGAWWLESDNTRHKPKLCDEHAILIGRVIYKQSERI